MTRSIFVALFAASACVSDPYPLAYGNISGVRIQPVEEQGDEWLHEHCVFHGVDNVESTQDAIAKAQNHRSNFAEPLSHAIEERNGWARSRGYGVAFFACQEMPPW